MTRYTATIQHHSIAKARVEIVGDTLAAAKRNATKEFGDGFDGHEISITDTTINNPYEAVVARRKIGGKGWATA